MRNFANIVRSKITHVHVHKIQQIAAQNSLEVGPEVTVSTNRFKYHIYIYITGRPKHVHQNACALANTRIFCFYYRTRSILIIV